MDFFRDEDDELLIGRIVGAIAVLVAAAFGIFKLVESTYTEPPCEVDKDNPGFCIEKEDYDEVVFVVGNTANSPVPDFDNSSEDKINLILRGVYYNQRRKNVDLDSRVHVISTSDPFSVQDLSGTALSKNYLYKNINYSEKKYKSVYKDLIKVIKSSPEKNGSRYMDAILEAKKRISDGAKKPVIVVIGSGLSDSGYIDFSKEYLFGSSKKFKNFASNAKLKKDTLKGVDIVWQWIGQATQQALPSNNKGDIENIYRNAIESLGGKLTLIEGDGNAKRYSVDTKNYIVKNAKSKCDFDLGCEKEVKFKSDSAELIDKKKTKKDLAEIIDEAKNLSGNEKMRITGYIANCDYSDKTLAKRRADSIKKLMVSMGVPKSKIITKGINGPAPFNFDNDDEMDCSRDTGKEKDRAKLRVARFKVVTDKK